jgi:hypothetical protein
MEILDFSQFARRKAAASAARVSDGEAMRAVNTDPWAMRHTESHEPDAPKVEFWSDLQFRLAYPTHRLRP